MWQVVNKKIFKLALQKYDWDCGVAVTAYLLRNKGYKVNYPKLIGKLGASESRGTDLVEIVKFFKSRPEFEVKVKDKSGFDWIEEEIGNGRVCLVAYQNWQRSKDIGQPDWGHYGVIYKIESGKVYLFDPGEETGLIEYTKEEFEKRWYEDDLDVYYLHWAMSLNLM